MKRWKRNLLLAHLVGSYLFFPLDYALWRFLSNAEMSIDVHWLVAFVIAPVSVPGILACLALWFAVDPGTGPSLLLVGTSWGIYLVPAIGAVGFGWGTLALRVATAARRRKGRAAPVLTHAPSSRLSEFIRDSVL